MMHTNLCIIRFTNIKVEKIQTFTHLCGEHITEALTVALHKKSKRDETAALVFITHKKSSCLYAFALVDLTHA